MTSIRHHAVRLLPTLVFGVAVALVQATDEPAARAQDTGLSELTIADVNAAFDAGTLTSERLVALYRDPRRILLATALRLASRIALTLEVWLAAQLMGFPITLWEALMLKSLTGALRGAAFVVPGGWGVQEGGYVVLGGLLGLSPEVMLAVSLATRARELLVSLPGLVAWQHGEGRSLWKRAASDDRC